MSKIVEEWRDIQGFEGLYQVSDWGNVKNKRGKMMKQSFSRDGYLRVRLGKKQKWYSVHRLVAKAFIPNPDNKPVVGHLKPLPDGTEDKTANEVWHLKWMTYIENTHYGSCRERIADAQKNDPSKARTVNQYTLDGEFVETYPSTKEIKRLLGFDDGNINRCCKGGFYSKSRNKWINIKQMYGYMWKYN